MNYAKNEIMQYVGEDDVKFIRLAFCDVFGRQKNMAILPGELDRAFDYGIPFDARSIEGFESANSDLFLKPDSSTLMGMPWRPDHDKVVRMLSDITYSNGERYECDTRYILQKAIKAADEMGLRFKFGTEQEFYLFELDQNGKPTDIPYDEAGYMDLAPDDKGENIRREICLTLEQIGIHPENSHHERGPGQNEIDVQHADPLLAADNLVIFEMIVKIVAGRNGLKADFSPLPIKDKAGSGLHINVSVKAKDGNDYLSQVMAGVLSKIAEMTIFFNTTRQSYERLGKNGAPRYITWSESNRSQLVRFPDTQGRRRIAELRSPDCTTNPYLAFALIIYAGIYGIKNNLQLPESVDKNPDRISGGYDKLPESFEEACKLASESEFLKEVLPEEILNFYCRR
ncbi:MAG: glutamine synthetase family protein [Lachnospiraceae bacterium]|nr:glutamine synthetase family protein [Lachnospiraceae bacterium]